MIEARLLDAVGSLAALHDRPDHIPLIGIAGAQGSGKTTLARAAAERLGAAHLSLDDVYLTRAERQALAREVHPLFAVRGPPGTHDLALLEGALAALRAAEAQLAETRAAEDVAQTGVTSAVVSRGSLEAAVENARAQVRLAQIDLDNTRITAPRDGRLGEVTVRQGQQVAVGTQMTALVPDVVWVTANMKENQMRDVHVGQPVKITVDALGGRVLTGKVERISPATGSEFSVIRPDNATGNFTKVAQRIPVRIAVDPGQEGVERLSPGMSVTARITVKN